MLADMAATGYLVLNVLGGYGSTEYSPLILLEGTGSTGCSPMKKLAGTGVLDILWYFPFMMLLDTATTVLGMCPSKYWRLRGVLGAV